MMAEEERAILEGLLREAEVRWGVDRLEALQPLLERTAHDLALIRREGLDLMEDPPGP